jgi:signal transduction histidine kinase
MKLTSKILLLLLGVVALITTVAGALSVQAAYADLEARQTALARQLATEMQDRLATAWQDNGPRGVTSALREWALQSEHPVTVHWVMFSQDVARELRPQAPPSSWPRLRGGQIFSIVSVDGDGVRRLHTYLPTEGFAGEIGALELSQPLEVIDQQTRQVVWVTLLSIGASALLGLMLAYVAGMRWVARPLEALIAHTERIGRGDFSHPLTLRGGDELDQLARALNDMSGRLAAQQATIARESQERFDAVEQLRHAERLSTLGRMAAGIAHELGTPLNVVAGRAALIASGRLVGEDVLSSARTIKAEADRITSIVQRLLDFARQRRPQRTHCELASIAQRTASLLQTLAEKKQVALEFQPPAGPTSCLVDESQIQQVLTNLIVNALQAVEPGGRVQLSIDAPQEGFLRMRVADDGPGIPPENRERIFEPFFTTKDVGEGTGLGLSIAYGIVQEHGGRLEVSSSQLGGAAFDVFLPVS